MAEPKKRMSVTRSKNRRRQQRASSVAGSNCPHCDQPVARHRIHPHCLDAHLKPQPTKS